MKKDVYAFSTKSLVNTSIYRINNNCHDRNHRFRKYIFDSVRAKCHNIHNLTSRK